MKLSRLAALTAAATAFCTALGAQNQNIIVPQKYAMNGSRNQTQPFAEPSLRYQQVFEKKELQALLKDPVRFKGLRFRSKVSNQPGFSITLQVAVGPFQGFTSGRFDNNISRAKIVFPRSTINLPTSAAGQFQLNIPFNADFTWDYETDIIVEVRMYGNGNNNKPFIYWFDSYVADFQVGGDVLWAIGPNAVNATTRLRGSGLVTRFDYQEGVALKYGKGCKGLGNFVPEISTNGIPVVGNTALRLNLTKAKPQVPCLLLWGGSREKWGAFTLPLNLKVVGIPDCTLFAEPLQIFSAVTLGGNPGTGIASLPFGIPPSNVFKGINLYAQWAVLDDSQSIRALPFSFSDAMRLSIG